MSLEDLFFKLFYLSPLILFLGVVLGGLQFKYLNKIGKVIWYYLLFALSVDLFGRILVVLTGTNLILIPFFGLGEFILIYWLYTTSMLTKLPAWSIWWRNSVVLVIILDILYSASISTHNFQSYGRVVDALCIVVLCLLYLWQLVRQKVVFNKSKLLFNSALLIYAITALSIFLPVNFLISAEYASDVRYYFWLFHFAVTIVFYLILIKILWKSGRTRKHLLSGWGL